MPKRKIEHVIEGRRYRVPLYPKPVVIICCDCGLTHAYWFKIKNGKLWRRAFLDRDTTRKQRATKDYRGLRLPKRGSTIDE